jgi:hypothetical protein
MKGATQIFGDELTEEELLEFVRLRQDELGMMLAIATPAMQARLDLLFGDRTRTEPPERTYGVHVRTYEGATFTLRVMKVSGEGEVLLAVETGGVLRR